MSYTSNEIRMMSAQMNHTHFSLSPW